MYTASDREGRGMNEFASFKDKLMVKSLGKRLAATKIGMNDMYPILKENRFKGKRVALVVNKL